MTPTEERIMWDSLLDAHMNRLYWGHVARRYQTYLRVARVILGVVSSATVVAWFAWMQWEWLWKVLSVLSALIAIVLSVWRVEDSIESMVRAIERWTYLHISYERLWASLLRVSDDEALAKFDEIKTREVELSAMEAKLPNIPGLLKKSHREVIKARGL